MTWTDSLSPADKDQLAVCLERLGAPAFELYVILTLRVALAGAIPGENLSGFIEDHGELDWHRIKGEFELRDGAWHIRRVAPLVAA